MFEIEAPAQAFQENGNQLEATRLFGLIDAEQGSAHSATWDYADELIGNLQSQKRCP